MSAELQSVPTELIQHIVRKLDDADLLRLRLVCRDLNTRTSSRVGSNFFRNLETDLSRDSLLKLKEMAEHKQIRDHAQVLIIKEHGSGLGKGILWPRHYDGRLMTPLPEIELLQKILVDGLVKCRSFYVRFGDKHKSLLYEDPAASGSGTFGSPFSDSTASGLTASDAIAIIFTIVANTSLPVEAFMLYGHFSRLFKVPSRSLDLARLDDSQLQSPQFRSGWAHIKMLHLGHAVLFENLDWSVGLILSASNLRKLAISHARTSGLRPDCFYIMSPFMKRLLSANTLPRLQELDLFITEVQEELLSELVLRFRDSLRRLSLSRVLLVGEGGWAAAFHKWGGKFPLLQDFCAKSVGEIRERKGSIDHGFRTVMIPPIRRDLALMNWLTHEEEDTIEWKNFPNRYFQARNPT